MSHTVQTAQQRINAMLRVLALVCVIIGALFVYYVYSATLIPQLIPIFYFMGGLLIFVGATFLILRFE